MTFSSSEYSDQPGHPPRMIRDFAVRMKKPWLLSYCLNAQRRLIRLGECPGWSESSLGAHAILLVLSCCAHIYMHSDYLSNLYKKKWQKCHLFMKLVKAKFGHHKNSLLRSKGGDHFFRHTRNTCLWQMSRLIPNWSHLGMWVVFFRNKLPEKHTQIKLTDKDKTHLGDNNSRPQLQQTSLNFLFQVFEVSLIKYSQVLYELLCDIGCSVNWHLNRHSGEGQTNKDAGVQSIMSRLCRNEPTKGHGVATEGVPWKIEKEPTCKWAEI